MPKSLIRVAHQMARSLGVELRRTKSPDLSVWRAVLEAHGELSHDVKGDDRDFIRICADYILRSKAQLFQDVFALYATDFKQGGYFVEFGATDGVGLSNTFLLEKEFGWTGVLAEPAKAWHSALGTSRTCNIDYRCVSAVSGESVTFNETEWLELSTIESISPKDNHWERRKAGTRYQVETVSLVDLLAHWNAPKRFDLLSVDTEGSELMILEAHDFSQFRPTAIVVEHNYVQPNRARIAQLLEMNGYQQRFAELSLFDDWYTLKV